jgi:hypothetical protein
LINGTLVRDPILISTQTELNGYYLDDLLSIKQPGFVPEQIPLDDKDIEQVLTDYSVMLHEHADDLLKGDFSIFSKLDKIVKARIVFNKDQ